MQSISRKNPWITVADLLSSVVLILLLLYVLAVIIPQFTQENRQRNMMLKIDSQLKEYEERGQIEVHLETGTLEFTSLTFDSGSAELTPATKSMIGDLSKLLIEYMASEPMMEILVEGHTDPAVVQSVRNKGGYFADNVQLSTLRAANVRAALLGYLGAEYAGRIGVAGYGETRLKNKENPLSPENRRIEIRILWHGTDDK